MKKKFSHYYLFIGMALMISIFMFSTKVEAQLWQALPPYNVLWPLWSPVLSPPDPVSGVPIPLVTQLTKNTVLPVQPALVWNPDLPYYYLLYNYIPTYGDPYLKYYDPTEYPAIGVYNSAIFQNWPPTYLLQTLNPFVNIYITVPNPLDLPVGYENLITIDPTLFLNWFYPLVNYAWQDYNGIDPYLLTASDLVPTGWIYDNYFGPVLVPAI